MKCAAFLQATFTSDATNLGATALYRMVQSWVMRRSVRTKLAAPGTDISPLSFPSARFPLTSIVQQALHQLMPSIGYELQ